MADWITWCIAAGAAVIVELLTGTFYLLMIALGLLAGALAAWLGAAALAQAAASAIVGGAATWLLYRRRARRPVTDVARDPNVNMDVGQTVSVQKWHEGRARVQYRGALWDVELAPGATPHPGEYRIAEVRGNRLIVGD
ncbi:MAG TPA: NfeD family protein [Telluria sp.]|nr:NfeD family protein [Telluria sp.]